MVDRNINISGESSSSALFWVKQKMNSIVYMKSKHVCQLDRMPAKSRLQPNQETQEQESHRRHEQTEVHSHLLVIH